MTNFVSFCAMRLVLASGRFVVDVWLHAHGVLFFVAMKGCAARIDIVRNHMRDVDRTLLREDLKLTFEQRAQKQLRALQMVEELRRAGKKLRRKSDGR
jgi:hypothetical protein